VNSYKWALLRKGFYLALPPAQYLLVFYGVPEGTTEQWLALVSVVASTVFGIVAADNVDTERAKVRDAERAERRANVSRETFSDAIAVANESDPADGITVYPCVNMHGSAEPHVLGCEGWTSERD
jgi:hypothetical protein